MHCMGSSTTTYCFFWGLQLPPNHLQPIIMAGLGTGAAPFRAFLQHRAWTAQQGISVGPMFYYFGSRHQSQEYLYGEEIEAYILDGIISKAGLFTSKNLSRHMKNKEIAIRYLLHITSEEKGSKILTI